MTESEVLRACLDYLSYRGIFHWRANAAAVPLKGGGFRRFVGLRGVSDILGVLPGGRMLAVECKRPGCKPSSDQDQFLDNVTKLGGVGIWVSSVSELEADLKELGVL